MASLPVTELTSRARDIFQRVVEEYIASGQPVGSKTLAADGTLNLSPASIRSVLADLETAGLLAAPHTSAGRMPTDAGLRIFVDGMMRVAEPTAQEQAAIEARLAEAGPVEAALKQASAILSDLSGAAGMVLVAPREQRLAQFSLVDLGQGRALAVLVGEDGAVENRVLTIGGALKHAALESASNYITARLAGRTLAEAAQAMRAEISTGQSQLDDASRDLVERGLAVWSADAAARPVLIVRTCSTRRPWAISSGCGCCSKTSKTSSRSRNCSIRRARRTRPASSSAARTACSPCQAPASSPRPTVIARGGWSACLA
jgi:heat-inducible transcriptional repressor